MLQVTDKRILTHDADLEWLRIYQDVSRQDDRRGVRSRDYYHAKLVSLVMTPIRCNGRMG